MAVGSKRKVVAGPVAAARCSDGMLLCCGAAATALHAAAVQLAATGPY
jgi:hypothetical protein